MDPSSKYLEALDSYLSPHLPEDLRKQRVNEIRTHLAMDQSDREASGVDGQTASRLARRALGSPRVLAREMVRQARGFDITSPNRLAFACGIALIPTLVLPFYFMAKATDLYWPELAARWLPFFVLVYFGFQVVRTRRWLAWSMAPWAAIGMVGAMVASLTPVTRPGIDNLKATQVINKSIAEVKAEARIAKAWQTGHPPLDQAPIEEQTDSQTTYYPLVPVGITRFKPTYTLTSVSAEQASSLWARNGKSYSLEVHERLDSLIATAASVNHVPQGDSPINWGNVAILWLSGTAEQVAVFAAVNWFLLALSKALSRRRNRRDPLLA